MFRFRAEENIFKRSSEIYPVKTEDNMFDLVLKGSDQIIRAKIIKGTSVNLRNANDQTLLHYAVLYNQVKIAKFLIDAGADLDAKDKFGQTVRDITQKHNSVLYNQPADNSISKYLLQTEQANVAKDVLGSSEDNDFCNIC